MIMIMTAMSASNEEAVNNHNPQTQGPRRISLAVSTQQQPNLQQNKNISTVNPYQETRNGFHPHEELKTDGTFILVWSG